MAAQFVYPQHPNYEPYRELARTAELTVNDYTAPDHFDGRTQDVRYAWAPVSVELAYPGDVAYMKPKHLNRAEKDIGGRTTWFWHRAGGINTLAHYKRWPEGFTNEGYRLTHSTTETWGDDSPQANELIAFGVGLLRPLKPRVKGFDKAIARFDGEETVVGRAGSLLAKRGMAHIVTIGSEKEGKWTNAPFALESTNLITPEVIGELQQLLERINDTTFLEAYLKDLLVTCTPVDIGLDGLDNELTHIHVQPSLGHGTKHSWREAYVGHIGQGIWDSPPLNVSELRYRINFLIDAIIIDAPKSPKAV